MTATRDDLDSMRLLDEEAILVGTGLQWPVKDNAATIDKMLKSDVIVLSLQDFPISKEFISAIVKHVEKGKGIVMIGLPPLKAPPAMPLFLRNFFEWVGYQPTTIDSIKRGFGFRVVKEDHTITNGLNGGDVFRTSTHEGNIFEELKASPQEKPASSTIQLIEQRVILEKKGEEAGSLVCPALVVSEKGDSTGRIVHFNFNIHKIDAILSPVLNRAISWAGRIDMKLVR